MNLNKFFSLPDLEKKIASERKQDKIIALAEGDFDLIHAGFIRYLREAKKTADILVVVLSSDRSLKALKGEKWPLIDEKGRIKMIAAFEYVDYVSLFDEFTPERVRVILEPDFYYKRLDDLLAAVPENEAFPGKTIVLGSGDKSSVSEILKKIAGSSTQAENRRYKN